MKVGFTGTRFGLKPTQRAALVALLDLAWINPTEGHHGDCVGADAEFHECLVGRECHIVIHPPIDAALRANCQNPTAAGVCGTLTILPPKSHFARNRDIVDQTDILIVCPMQSAWQPRGGTWYTYDYAKKVGKDIYVLWPDGQSTFTPLQS